MSDPVYQRLVTHAQALCDDAVGLDSDPLWIVRRELVEALRALLASPPPDEPTDKDFMSAHIVALQQEIATLKAATPDEPPLSAYLKDGETAAECIARNRADVDTALTLLAKEKHKVERYKALIGEVAELARRMGQSVLADRVLALSTDEPEAHPREDDADRA